MKKLLIILILLGAAAWFFGPRLLGKGVKIGVEQGGTWALDAETRLDSAELHPLAGSLALHGLSVAAPKGFKESPAFAIDDIAVQVNRDSLTSDVIRIDSIEIREPLVALEANTNGTNLGALMDTLKAKGGSSASPESAPETAKDSGKPSKKLNIARITIVKPRVRLAQSIVGSSSGDVVLKTIELKDVGTESAPTDVTAALEQVIGAILGAAAEANLGLPDDVKQLLNGEAASKVTAQVKQQLDKAKDALQNDAEKIKNEAGKTLDDLKKDVGGLFGGGKKD